MRPISDYTIFDIGAERNKDQKKAYRNMWIAASAGFAALLLFGFVGHVIAGNNGLNGGLICGFPVFVIFLIIADLLYRDSIRPSAEQLTEYSHRNLFNTQIKDRFER